LVQIDTVVSIAGSHTSKTEERKITLLYTSSGTTGSEKKNTVCTKMPIIVTDH